MTSAAAGDPDASARNLIGTAIGHETAADGLALEAIADDDTRDVLLEAATLWLGALVGSHNQHGDWLAEVHKDAGKHPDYVMRVWYLNGRFSMRARQGAIAQEITRQVEALANWRDPHPDDATFAASAEVFARLWAVATSEVKRAEGG